MNLTPNIQILSISVALCSLLIGLGPFVDRLLWNNEKKFIKDKLVDLWILVEESSLPDLILKLVNILQKILRKLFFREYYRPLDNNLTPFIPHDYLYVFRLSRQLPNTAILVLISFAMTSVSIAIGYRIDIDLPTIIQQHGNSLLLYLVNVYFIKVLSDLYSTSSLYRHLYEFIKSKTNKRRILILFKDIFISMFCFIGVLVYCSLIPYRDIFGMTKFSNNFFEGIVQIYFWPGNNRMATAYLLAWMSFVPKLLCLLALVILSLFRFVYNKIVKPILSRYLQALEDPKVSPLANLFFVLAPIELIIGIIIAFCIKQ